ncbi:MAG: hypothetical protein MRY83_04955, partial [Flavobacteriales bacterium]|nr:hypothetical protein [Flavobacteriales bacterium]
MNSTIYRLNSSCTISLFFVPLFYFGQMSAQTSEKGWELRKDKNGIRVFTMLETGNDIKSYKVMFSVDHPKHVLEKVLTDVDKMADWTANLEVCEIV